MAIMEPDTQTITACCSTQTLKSELLINVAGYYIHQDPASILFIQPTQKVAEDFSKERFAPTRESTQVLKDLIPSPKSRDSGVTITHKEFPGGTLDFVGANSPVDLASRPKRIVLSDEIDKYPVSAGSEGDPLALGEERASTFWNHLFVRACSPTEEGTSAIWREYMSSDQRKCFVPCPHCDHRQVLYWSENTVLWDKDEDGNHLPDTVQYHCEACGAGWSEAERLRAVRSIADLSDYGWRQTRDFKCCGETQSPSRWNEAGRSLCTECGEAPTYERHAGFQATKLISTRHALPALVREFLKASKSRELLKKFRNTGLAEVWKEDYAETDPRALKERVEPYSAEVVPEAVKLITAGVDVQGDRLEIQVVGFGADEEAWVLCLDVLHGDPGDLIVWNELDHYLKQPFTTAEGRRLLIQATCVDSNYLGEKVHLFCRTRIKRRIYPISGMANDGINSKLLWPKTPSRSKNAGDRVYSIGVDTGKDEILARLNAGLKGDGPQPYALHFPHDGLTADYFEQLTSERAVTKYKMGRAYRAWEMKDESKPRNEALDTLVYALAARNSLPKRLMRPSRVALTTAPVAKTPAAKETKPAPVQQDDAPAPAPVPVPEKKRMRRARWKAYA